MSTKQPDETLHQHAARELSFILRNRALWPEGFEWDYSQCETCAMGLAIKLGMTTGHFVQHVADRLGMPAIRAQEIFLYAHGLCGPRSRADITPEHIADLLDAYADRAAAAKVGA